jgi:hypothetical protein
MCPWAVLTQGKLCQVAQGLHHNYSPESPFLNHRVEQVAVKVLVTWDEPRDHRCLVVKEYQSSEAARPINLEQLPGSALEFKAARKSGNLEPQKWVELGSRCFQTLCHLYSTDLPKPKNDSVADPLPF